MTIILSSQTGASLFEGINPSESKFDGIGSPVRRGFTDDIRAVRDIAAGILNKLTSKENNEQSFVESGSRSIVGGGTVSGNRISPIEDAADRVWATQTPNFSVVIKKRAFSGLKNLYNQELMSNAEKWLIRATKRLIARKCSIMADYERLTKIQKLTEEGADPSAIMFGLLAATGLGSDDLTGRSEELAGLSNNKDLYATMKALEREAIARQPNRITTFFVDPSIPVLEDFGIGSGVFEITAIGSLNTSLDLDGGGNCSFTVEDPYHILHVTEEDIETSLLETANARAVQSRSRNAGKILSLAQFNDERLNSSRAARGRQAISFTVDVRGGGYTAQLDGSGLRINEEIIALGNVIPEEQSLNEEETRYFEAIAASLTAYADAMQGALAAGVSRVDETQENDMRYARNKMRLFYLGKSIIQPMDSIHIFIDGGTRRAGEGENVEDVRGVLSVDQAVRIAHRAGSETNDQVQLDDNLILQEYLNKGISRHISFNQFKKLRALDFSRTGVGIQVFGGLVQSATDKYEADSGKYVLAISANTNMEWIKISRYNTSPSLNQTQGIVMDPLTIFDIETDRATGLPTGELKLLPENESRVNNGCLYINNGPGVGQRVSSMDTLRQDWRLTGSALNPIYDHAPGLVYRWKEGIMTATYDMQSTSPQNKKNHTRADKRQLRRDVGFFSSNTPFDNMDAANIISIIVTGHPHNYSTFVQSAAKTGAFVPDTTFNTAQDFFHTFLDVVRSLNTVQGGFLPYKPINSRGEEAVQALRTQQRLSGQSARLLQLRGQEANIMDRKDFLGAGAVSNALGIKLKGIREEIQTLEKEFNEELKQGEALQNNVVRVAGDDVSFDFFPQNSDDEDLGVFGDRLLYSVLKKKEEVVYNRDKNYLIISDEYDRDFDIQAFVLRLRDHSPKLWDSTWQSAHDLCTTVAEFLNFEFFCDTQGNIVFRPPQYNRTPLSVMEAMFILRQVAGIKVFPDFLTSLFQTREESIIRDIKKLEWEIILNAALLGATSEADAEEKILTNSGQSIFFLTIAEEKDKAISLDRPLEPQEKEQLRANVRQINSTTRASAAQNSGLFSATAQRNLQKSSLNRLSASQGSGKALYEKARDQIATITGRQVRSFAEFDQAKIGASRNGQITPATDVSNTISKIANLISRRSKLLLSLDRVLSQNIQVGKLNEHGEVQLGKSSLAAVGDYFNKFLTGIASKIIEDTRTDTLGHLSSQRYIINDEHIRSYSFTEQPPEMTNVVVSGTDPIVGETGGRIAGGMPVYLAYGVDFDTWRQYGWRGERPFEKPFFWSAELQCAPYAVMLLSRQRKNIVQGEITVYGNEFYQLGDVVYVTDRQLLYYVHSVSHNISYDGQFSTTLKLKYGHPPGEYIPTPLDIIGKSATTRGGAQNSFRSRRQTPATESPIRAVLRFPTQGDQSRPETAVSGSFGQRNYDQLMNFVSAVKKDLDEARPNISPRIYIMTFTDAPGNDERISAIRSWLRSPKRAVTAGDLGGADGALGSQPDAIDDVGDKITRDVVGLKVPMSLVYEDQIRQCISDDVQLTPEEERLIRLGFVASDKAYHLDETLETIVELRLRFPPSGGWD